MQSLSLRLMALLTLMLFLSSLVACPAPSRGDDDDATDDDDAVGDDDDDDDDDATDDDDAAGGPEVLSTCGTAGTGSIPVTGDAIEDPAGEAVLFDIYTVDAVAGDCIWVKGDNGAEGADILAFVADAGQNYYGMASDWSQLDDEWGCSTPHANGFGCPEAAVEVMVDGPVMIGIGLWPEEGISASAYTLNIAVNGTDVDPGAPTQDDTPIQ
jgi:hypothetical protein